ncbi:MAG: PPK2 family polyphosphate kinase [Ferrimicrobium sp.]
MDTDDLTPWFQRTLLRAGGAVPKDSQRVVGAPEISKDVVFSNTPKLIEELSEWQEALYAESRRGLLIVLQGLDTAGKDGILRSIFQGINPQGVVVTPFKAPTPWESAHDFLFRIHRSVPERGMIGIFNRSHYEDLVVPTATKSITDAEYRRRVAAIESFEEYLADEGIVTLKLYLQVSYEVQGARLLRRLDQPNKHWKFSSSDLVTREHWNAFASAYAKVVPDTSFPGSPWHVIPADHKWYRNWVGLATTLHTLRTLHPVVPSVDIAHIERLRREIKAGLSHADA